MGTVLIVTHTLSYTPLYSKIFWNIALDFETFLLWIWIFFSGQITVYSLFNRAVIWGYEQFSMSHTLSHTPLYCKIFWNIATDFETFLFWIWTFFSGQITVYSMFNRALIWGYEQFSKSHTHSHTPLYSKIFLNIALGFETFLLWIWIFLRPNYRLFNV
jgi:hypothetical protein